MAICVCVCEYKSYVFKCVCVCSHGPLANLVNHCCAAIMRVFTCACVCVYATCLPGGLSLPAVPLCESEVSPLELPSALIWS